jgi:hypothetical protein
MLKPSNDSKVRARKSQQNTLGLPPGPEGSCPCATTGPGGCWCQPAEGRVTHTCYVDKLQHAYPGVRKILAHNFDEINKALDGEFGATPTAYDLLKAEFTRFEAAESKARRTGSADFKHRPAYRLHWSGDIHRCDYGEALGNAMTDTPGVDFWLYTRCFEENLHWTILYAENVYTFLSLDPCNLEEGMRFIRRMRKQHPGPGNRLRISWMGNEIPEALKLFAEKELGCGFFNCPVDSGKMPLEGACQNHCRFCISNVNKVLVFETSKPKAKTEK